MALSYYCFAHKLGQIRAINVPVAFEEILINN